jgi:hypothetical protein
MTHDEIYRQLYYRVNGSGRKLYKCRKCGDGPISIVVEFVSSEPCCNEDCGATDWRELTEAEFLAETHLISDVRELPLPSSYLASRIADLYESETNLEEWTRVLRKLVQGLEGFADKQTAAWLHENFEKRPEIVEHLIDEMYTRDFLKNARKMVDRTTKLVAMVPKATSDKGVNIYLREATRSYVAGSWSSSVAFSRSTLELALEQRVKEKIGHLPTGPDKFKNLIEWAAKSGLIEDAHQELARQVRRNGNDVIHESLQADENLARNTLEWTRGILDHLYYK